MPSIDTEGDKYNSVTFNSTAHEKFRIHLNEEMKGFLKVHLEARTSKKQWKSCISSEEGFTINGIPTEGVFRALRVRNFFSSIENLCSLILKHTK
jgi:hypothetical protein